MTEPTSASTATSDPQSALISRAYQQALEVIGSVEPRIADAIRAELAELGVTLADTPSGTEWSIAQ